MLWAKLDFILNEFRGNFVYLRDVDERAKKVTIFNETLVCIAFLQEPSKWPTFLSKLFFSPKLFMNKNEFPHRRRYLESIIDSHYIITQYFASYFNSIISP